MKPEMGSQGRKYALFILVLMQARKEDLAFPSSFPAGALRIPGVAASRAGWQRSAVPVAPAG